ncbi:MAG: ATP-binding protein [Deltaproteobacteria bacterium]|jgi:predicted ATP-dependent endonuclease of OLD family|nr:ATP-binding protein [Deltaproteobacteria bacterium]
MLVDGINRLIQIVLIILANPGSIILIDEEIETGFHYSFFPKLWEIIGKLSLETDCQVFATTHSYECIKGTKTLYSNVNNSKNFYFITLNNFK